MYITQILIADIRSIQRVDWQIAVEDAPGWHVVLGDNGSGKSTFIRSVALALIGPSEAKALRQDWNEWVRNDQHEGMVGLLLAHDPAYDLSHNRRSTASKRVDWAAVNIERQRGGPASLSKYVPGFTGPKAHDPDQRIWGNNEGWFSASYGPFRRFSGGDKEFEKIFSSNPKLAAHLSAFGENIALSEGIQWLQDLKFKELEHSPEGDILAQITDFVNQDGFLPHQARLENVSSNGVVFIDGNGCEIGVEELSDGYRSILSMTFELIRQMTKAYPGKPIFSPDRAKVIVPGVVLIDEVDAHLHPSWQRRVGLWFREHFPNIQFIVTTHSPFICQAADAGTVWRLPNPGSDEEAGMVTGTDLERLLYGNVLDAYSTDIFGSGTTRSTESRKRLQRLAELNTMELERELTTSENAEMEHLRASQPTAAHTLSGANGRS